MKMIRKPSMEYKFTNNKIIKKVCFYFLFFVCMFFCGNLTVVEAITEGSTAKCVYGSSEANSLFTLTYKDGKLAYTGSDSTGYVKYTSMITIANLTDSNGNLKCPSKVYFVFEFDGPTRSGTKTFYATKQANELALDESASEVVNKEAAPGEENQQKALSCAYGNLVISSDGKTITGAFPGYNVNISFTLEEFGDKCPEKVCATCTRGYCGVYLKSIGGTYETCSSLNGSSEMNSEELEEENQPEDTKMVKRINDFISNTIGATTNCGADDKACLTKQEKLYKEAKLLSDYCKQIKSNMNYAEGDEIYDKCGDFDAKFQDFAKNGYFGNRVIGSSYGSACRDTLGSLGVWLKIIYDIVKFAVPVIIVIMGVKDFVSGLMTGKDDALKKASSTFVKRLIWGAVFIALPVLITMILTFAFGGGFADICIF